MGILKTLSFGRKRKTERQPGKFIVIDGIDGSGKTTQVNLLIDTLKVSGYEVDYIHFPQHGHYSAALVDAYLAGAFGPMTAQAASVFFALDRFEAAPKIRQWLSEGKIVIADRYVTSNAGHQGGKLETHSERVKYFRWLANLEYEVFKIPKPDLNIVLNVPATVALRLVEMRNEREQQTHVDVMHELNIEHLNQSEEIYKEIAALFPNTKMVECVENSELLPPQRIHGKVWELVRRITLKDLKPQS